MATTSESYTPWVIGAMDKLWFQKAVLSAEQTCSDKDSVPMIGPNPCSFSSSYTSSESQRSSNSSYATTDCSDDDVSADFCRAVHGSLPIIPTNLEIYSEDEDDKKKGERPNLVMKRAKSSSSPTRRRMTKTRARLARTKSCMSPTELELEEVKGFMDLGFNFDKDRLTPRMISVVPGLQRLSLQDENNEEDDNELEEEEEAKKKPYLSEAWLINKPNSPLLRLRISRVSTTSSDMKRHLKLWAKTVAHSTTQ